jgi:hypothetical protein
MKKMFVLILLASFFFTQTAYAHSKKDKRDYRDDYEYEYEYEFEYEYDDDDDNDKKRKGYCAKDHSKGLHNALKNVKNPKAREAIKKNIEKQKQKWLKKCKDGKDDVELTDGQKAAVDKAQLSITFGGTDNAGSVTVPITKLPKSGANGSVITWSSNQPSILSHDGKTLNRPAVNDVNVTLTATIKLNDITLTKSFILTVKKQMFDTAIVAADKAALAITFGSGDTASSVTKPLAPLPLNGVNGSSIHWISSNPAIISNNGQTVNRPAASDAVVVMTAVITSGTITDTKTFNLTVKHQLTDAQKVAADKAALQITYKTGDSAAHVTRALQTLPSTGVNGSNITWISSNPSIVSNNGQIVNRPAAGSGDAVIIMTAILTKGATADNKSFTLTVKQQLTTSQKVTADKATLQITFAGSDTAASVTRPLAALPTTGVNGSSITWNSSQPGILSHNGQTINRPALGAGDATVVFMATIINQNIMEIKTFTLVVKAEYTDAKKVEADKADLAIVFAGNDTLTHVTAPLVLPASGVNGTTIGWYSSNPSIVSHNGSVVNRPAKGSGDAAVTLTAIISVNGSYDTKNFVLTVKQLP